MVDVGDQSVPHWALLDDTTWPLFDDFEVFMEAVWVHLGLPQPTLRQRQIARFLQRVSNSGNAAEIVRAFRGVGKSYITCAFVLWRLMRNPKDEKVLVVSATGGKAKEFVSMAKSLLRTMDALSFLRPGPEQRDMADRFDVAGASISQSYSVKAAGITGQITGGRATLIVPDDIEIPANSKTEEARARLMHYTSEFEAIKLPGADVIFLGTPQTEESIYNRLVRERGYGCYCVPARFPMPDKMSGYEIKRDDGTIVQLLAPELLAEADAGTLAPGQPTDPQRFDEVELASRESKGRAFFALQYQLDTSLSDAERYPLRTTDLVVFETNPKVAPVALQWGRHSDAKNVIHDIPNLGFQGDILLRPLFADESWRPFEGKVCFVDPSGRGKDETAWAIVGHLNGWLYLLHMGALSGDPATAMRRIAEDAKRFDVNVVEVEPNFGGGMWTTAFQPVLTKVWPGGCTVKDSEWAKGQKEARIIDTLEPVMTQHRLVVNESLLRADSKAEDREFSLLFQLTHITRDRNSLRHDDRLDALAGAVAHFRLAMGLDTDAAAKALLEAEREALIEDYMAGLDEPGMGFFTGRGVMRADGERPEVHTWSPGSGHKVYRGSTLH